MRRNAFFQLVHKEDGTYLKSYPASEGGDPLSVQDIIDYLERRGLEYDDPAILKTFVELAEIDDNAMMKFTSKKLLPEKEFPVITVDPRKRAAKIRLYPPSSKGNRISIEDIKDLIEQAGIKYGLIEKNIEIMWKARLYCTDILIAKAKMPVQGKNAEITYYFDAEKTCTPKVAEDGSVDFHHLDMIEKVDEGQLLATLRPADYGEPGIDVTGEKILPGKVKTLILKYGKHIRLSEDKLEMYSEISGNVTLVNDTVFVSDMYEVAGDVGATTGDIDYAGSVTVAGNVLTGYTVKAEGDIIVNGAVEGATLQAGGKIILKSGIQGMQKGVMESGGDIIANFIESSQVRAGGRIMTDAILHSKAIAEDSISIQGKRGLVVGGMICSKSRIEAKTAGSTMGTVTELEVGIDPMVKEEYVLIEKEMSKLKDEKESLLQNLKILKKRMAQNKGKLDQDKMAIYQNSTQRVLEIEKELEEHSKRHDELGEELDAMGEGRVIVYGVAYPGVKITVANVSRELKQECKYSAFVRDGADIRITAI